MKRANPFIFIKKLDRPVFTTREMAEISGKSLSGMSQALTNLEKQGLVFSVSRGVWAEAGRKDTSPHSAIPALFPKQRAYLSFISALHLYGIIEQIPQVITLAVTSHTRLIKTKLGVFHAHKITPSFFKGFDWYKKTGNFLIADQEKALLDCLYLSVFKKKEFAYFPELYFGKDFSWKKAASWLIEIKDPRIQRLVKIKFDELIKRYHK